MLRVLTFLTDIGGVLAWVLASYTGLFSLYMATILLGAWLASRTTGSVTPVTSFVVIIPAHNEEAGISSTVRQILACDYPQDRISIVVIADNCTDKTADRAREAGARVLQRNDPTNRGKGQALSWALGAHRERFGQSDLIAFIDADMNVHKDFFRCMDSAIADAYVQVAQGRYVIANPGRGALSALGFASYCYVNDVRPAGRCFWGGTADLKGSGMVFRSSFLLPRGWGAHSIAEDVQLAKELMLEGTAVKFVPGAVVTSEIPSTLSQVRVQQSRWDGGKNQVLAAVIPRTVTALLHRPSILLLDGLLDMLVPPLSAVVMINLLGLALSWWAAASAVWIFTGSLVVFALAVVTGLVRNGAPAAVYWRLAAAPFFVLWKLALLARLTFKPAEKAWNRTPRDST